MARQVVDKWYNARTEGRDLGERMHLPPMFVAVSDWFTRMWSCPGTNCHCGANWNRCSLATNCWNVTAPLPTQVPGPTAALNVAGLPPPPQCKTREREFIGLAANSVRRPVPTGTDRGHRC